MHILKQIAKSSVIACSLKEQRFMSLNLHANIYLFDVYSLGILDHEASTLGYLVLTSKITIELLVSQLRGVTKDQCDVAISGVVVIDFGLISKD